MEAIRLPVQMSNGSPRLQASKPRGSEYESITLIGYARSRFTIFGVSFLRGSA